MENSIQHHHQFKAITLVFLTHSRTHQPAHSCRALAIISHHHHRRRRQREESVSRIEKLRKEIARRGVLRVEWDNNIEWEIVWTKVGCLWCWNVSRREKCDVVCKVQPLLVHSTIAMFFFFKKDLHMRQHSAGRNTQSIIIFSNARSPFSTTTLLFKLLNFTFF